MRRFLKVIGLQALGLGALVQHRLPARPRFVVPLFGAAWHDAAVYIQIMCAVYFVQSTMHPVHPTLQILQRQARQAAVGDAAPRRRRSGDPRRGAMRARAPRRRSSLYAGAQAGAHLILLVIQLHAMREAGRLTPPAAPPPPDPA